MPIIEKAQHRKPLSKITITEENHKELLNYLNYLGYDKKRETEGIEKIIDGALTLLFKTEQKKGEYIKFKDDMERKNREVIEEKEGD